MRDGKVTGIAGVKDHDLGGLALAVKASLNDSERGVLRRLSYFVGAAGRYPIPRRAQEMKPRRVRGRGTVDPGFFNIDDWATARTAADRLLGDLRARMYDFRPRGGHLV